MTHCNDEGNDFLLKLFPCLYDSILKHFQLCYKPLALKSLSVSKIVNVLINKITLHAKN